MQQAAGKFLASLSPELKQKATFGFDDPHRLKWYFTPQQDKQKHFTPQGRAAGGNECRSEVGRDGAFEDRPFQ